MASSNAAARGNAAQAVFHRKTAHYRREIPDLRVPAIVSRPLVRTDGRPHPAVTRSLQYAADIASSRNGQQMSAEAHQHGRTNTLFLRDHLVVSSSIYDFFFSHFQFSTVSRAEDGGGLFAHATTSSRCQKTRGPSII